ncbi:MAG: hypothetical protein ACREX9_21210, partial [Gammaproteobacteria bacterium]
LGRTTAQEVAILGDGRRLVFWAPETLVKLAIPKKIALGAAMVRSLDQVVDAETGRVSGIGAAIVMRREGLDQERYVRLLSGTLHVDCRAPLTGRLWCAVANAKGEKLELDLCFREKAIRAEPAGAQPNGA